MQIPASILHDMFFETPDFSYRDLNDSNPTPVANSTVPSKTKMYKRLKTSWLKLTETVISYYLFNCHISCLSEGIFLD